MNITKVIIPAAGLGTRFLPYTKTIAKEMLPLGNKPAIQYIVEEGIASGLNQFFIIVNKEKVEIKNYFSHDKNIENILEQKGLLHTLDSIKAIEQAATLSFIEQQEPKGLGHAVLMAREQVGTDYCAVILPDDIMIGAAPGIGQLIEQAKKYNASIIAVQEVPQERVSSYGIVAIKEHITPDLFEVSGMVEKPQPQNAPSRLGIIGRYVLSPKIFDALIELQSTHTNGELQLTDAIRLMMERYNEKVYVYKIKGTRYDIGNPKGWMQAIVDIASQSK